MKAVITADIINSTQKSTKSWMDELKKALNIFGEENKDWEIYRGDEFQMILEKPEQAFRAAMIIKASLNVKIADAKIAIGLGEISFEGKTIKESNGSAFVNSGRTLEILKNSKTETLSIKSENSDFDENFNLIFQLLETSFGKWTESTATAILSVLKNPEQNQQQIAENLGISQGAFSRSLKRGNIDAVQATDKYFRRKIAAFL